MSVITYETFQKLVTEKVQKKLDEHNRFSDKIGNIQTDIASIKTDLKYIKGESK